jgi:hypothetical protein
MPHGGSLRRLAVTTLFTQSRLYLLSYDFIYSVHDPPDIGREQKAGNEFAIDFTSFAIAHCALKTELSPSIRHGGFTSG